MANKHNSKIDKHFRENFEHFEFSPSNQLWEKIDEAVNHSDFDEVFQRKLGRQEIDPSPRIWEKIAKEIPINLFVRTILHRLSKVAVIVLLGFLATWHYTNPDYSSNDEIFAERLTNKTSHANHQDNNQSGNYMVEHLIVPQSKRQQVAQQLNPQPKDTKALLDAILADDEAFASKVDHDKISLILQPIEPVSFDDATANLGDELFLPPLHPDDLIINVPLVVIEEREIEGLLKKYEEFEARKKKKN